MSGTTYSFAGFTIDTRLRELTQGGRTISIEPSVFDLLVHLIVNRQRVVSRDELLRSVWQGRFVSDSTIAGRINAARQAVADTGKQQHIIRTYAKNGFRFVAQVTVSEVPAGQPPPAIGPPKPIVSFVEVRDGTRLATTVVGSGPVLVRAAHWYNHIEAEWDNPLTAPLLHELAGHFRLVLYDGRGAGLSDRDVKDMSFANYVSDLTDVVDTLQLRRFALLGMSGGAATSIAFTCEQPKRVTRLALHGGYAEGRNERASSQTEAEAQAFLTMIRSAWNRLDAPFWRAFCSFFLPRATPEQLRLFSDLHSKALSLQSGIMARTAVDAINVRPLLDKVTVPTMISHCVNDQLVPFEQGRLLARAIKNAVLVPLESENHLPVFEEDAAKLWSRELVSFLSQQ
ncbi:alpha/beta fold hydrolase [Bradyrhizobium sp. Arg68]|uniref:alpha/beta fold hydrolase n=1 Tax=Bradyrhizobium ivorense TaxID=2511166 RepID=UPI001E440836|nr:alpha/beta fold hydrolase [Bradyrhizobium ivorense]MCC8939455.1 alpha/beta fold hydrolase [Bradyrhizobium ivorense]